MDSINSKITALESTQVVIDGQLQPAQIVIEGGKFTQINAYKTAQDFPVEDMADLVIMPGLVDTHVHINEPGRTEWEGFNTGTQSAAAGGITCVVDMPLNCTPVTTNVDALRQKIASLDSQLWIDCGFWGGVIPDSLGDLDELINAGVLGVKSFTIHSGIDDFPKVDAEHLSQAIEILAKYNVPYLIHAELDKQEQEPPQIGDKYQSFLRSRPKSWENDAIDMMIDLAEKAKEKGKLGKIHIVHLSSAEALPAIRSAQQRGLNLTAESCPHYLTLFAENIPDGKTLFKCCPPIRELDNREQLWQGLADGTISFVVSDHSPCTPTLKHIDTGDIENAWGGISSLQFGLSIIWTEAKKRGFDLAEVVNWMATKPANFAGLGHRKGKIACGHDADLVLFDSEKNYCIESKLIKYRHKITPYEGRIVTGMVKRTYVRGEVVYKDNKLLGKPIGKPILAHR
jgi:allantoinase